MNEICGKEENYFNPGSATPSKMTCFFVYTILTIKANQLLYSIVALGFAF